MDEIKTNVPKTLIDHLVSPGVIKLEDYTHENYKPQGIEDLLGVTPPIRRGFKGLV